jgi:DNA-binding NtrC family response regulator
MEGYTGVPRRVLVLCRDIEASRVIEEATRPWMFETVACSSADESLRLLEQEDFALIFCAEQYADGTYRDLLRSAQPHKAPVVIMVSDPNPDAVFREAMSLGALGVLNSPCSKADVQWMVIRATQKGPAVRAS